MSVNDSQTYDFVFTFAPSIKSSYTMLHILNGNSFVMNSNKILISGASRRLGLFLCKTFLEHNYQVIALTRSTSDELHALTQDDKLRIIEIKNYDVPSINAVLKTLTRSEKSLHAIIHNSSVFEKDDVDGGYIAENYRSLFDIHMNLPAQLNFGLSNLLYNDEMPGNIIHITDIYVDNPNSDYILYCSTKAALENLSKGFAKKFAPGIRVNTIQPGPIKFLSSHSEQQKEKVLNETLLQCEGGFMPIYQAISSILQNPYMTGSSIKVDGGRALGRG